MRLTNFWGRERREPFCSYCAAPMSSQEILTGGYDPRTGRRASRPGWACTQRVILHFPSHDGYDFDEERLDFGEARP